MADVSKSLGSKFVKANRYANFGACINSVSIKGFRGLTCQLEFEYPVTAITGLNGAGKSTVGQLLLCAYKKLSTSDYKRFYVKDFFPVSVADPKPFADDASVEYSFQTNNPTEPQSLTVSRAKKEWSGYKRQPEKASIYLGLTFYLPKVERRDLTIYSAKNIKLAGRAEVEEGAKWSTRILGNAYDEVFFQGVKTDTREAELGMAKRLGAVYSENNMGFGEGRVIHTIRLLESCPVQSLIVLEEPETSLHEFAQYEFAKYLMDVSLRRGHQVIFSSHSSAMIRALPPEGRKMLARDNDGVKVYDHLSSIHLRNALTEGREGHLIVCVEDAFAQSFLQEIVARRKPALRKRIKVLPFGDANAVKGAVEVLRKSEVKAVGVRDGDQAPVLASGLNILPDGSAPEKSVFLSSAGKAALLDNYGFNLAQHLIAYPETDHHNFAKEAVKASGGSQQVIEMDCIRAYLGSLPDDWGQDLIDWIESQA